jgi:predicted O-methyltransferase YrrM
MQISAIQRKVLSTFYCSKAFRLLKSRQLDDTLSTLRKSTLQNSLMLYQVLNTLRESATLEEDIRFWIDRIERERGRLLEQDSLLVAGRNESGGLYDEGVTVSRACRVSKPPRPALLLYLIARYVKPKRVIELGTNVGISSAYLGSGLKSSGVEANLATLDASPYRLKIAKKVHESLRLDNITYVAGLFQDTLETTLKSLGEIDLAFIDGHHQYQPTLDYFEKILRFSAPNAVFVFDDIRWSKGMKKAWSDIQLDKRLGLVLDLQSVGICVLDESATMDRFVSDPIYVF